MDMAQLADGLVLWIKDKVSSAGSKGVVLGLSGGLDSAVAAVLSKRAFPQSVLGLLMPCFSLEDDIKHADLVAAKFSIPTKTVVLDKVFEALLGVLPDGKGSQLAQANLKPRLRMLTLYYYANELGYLVIGTGNKSELAVGYFTKYGDGGADILPLGNLVKREVKELARHLEIPQEIIDKSPSAGLWVGQTDEGELGLTYDELDRYLLDGQASDEVRKKIEQRMASSWHKLRPPEVADLGT